jgi:hypothetical protein
MTGLTLDVPQGHGISLRGVVEPRHARYALGDFALRLTGRTQTTQVAFDICSEYGHACITESFCQALQGHGFPGTRRPGNQPVPVAQPHCL